MIHELKFREEDADLFRAIADKKKRIEVRAGGKAEYERIAKGDTIRFCFGKNIAVRKVADVIRVPTLDALLERFTVGELAATMETKEAYRDRVVHFPGYAERIAEYGLIVLLLNE